MKEYKIVVPVSGGKDSQCCLKMAVAEHGPENVIGLFCDTNFEHPITYKHIQTISNLYRVKIEVINDGDVLSKCQKYKRFPSGRARFCTDELKIRPTKVFCKELAEKQGGFEVWYGMRIDESVERSKRYQYRDPDELYPPHEIMPRKYPQYLQELGVMFRLPICDWTEKEVLDYIRGEENPLYQQGFRRVGCFPCLASGDRWKLKAFNHDEFGNAQFIAVKQIESEIEKSIWTSGIGRDAESDSQGCAVCSI